MAKANRKRRKKWPVVVVVLAVICILAGALGDSEPTADQPNDPPLTVVTTPEPSVEPSMEPEPEPEPESEPEPEPDPEPEPEPEPEEEQEIRFLSDTREVHRNEQVTVTVQGKPNTTYYISVTYHSGHVSEANGLGPAVSDENGLVSWTWKVGGRTGFGSSYFTVTDGETPVRYDFEVVDQ